MNFTSDNSFDRMLFFYNRKNDLCACRFMPIYTCVVNGLTKAYMGLLYDLRIHTYAIPYDKGQVMLHIQLYLK